MSKKAKYMDALAGLSDDDDDSEDEEGSKGEQEAEDDAPGLKKQKSNKIDLETLERCGYKSGPSVLLMPTPKDAVESNWGWGSGQEQKQEEREHESLADRQANRDAVTSGLSASVAASKKAAEMKELQVLERKREAAEARARAYGSVQSKKEHKGSWNQKEKRKRDAGQATRGKNFVEEEKRLGRSLGMYSGFD